MDYFKEIMLEIHRWASLCKTLASLTTSPLTSFIPPLTLICYFELKVAEVNEVRQFVNILSPNYISFYLLASRTRIDVVELIAKKYLLLWLSFCVLEVTFYSLILF